MKLAKTLSNNFRKSRDTPDNKTLTQRQFHNPKNTRQSQQIHKLNYPLVIHHTKSRTLLSRANLKILNLRWMISMRLVKNWIRWVMCLVIVWIVTKIGCRPVMMMMYSKICCKWRTLWDTQISNSATSIKKRMFSKTRRRNCYSSKNYNKNCR